MTKTLRTTRQTAPVAISERASFTNGTGSFSGRPLDMSWLYTGYLPGAWTDRLSADVHAGSVTYVVFSYATPIAWELSDGTVVIPDVKYSRTTSGHQSLALYGFATGPGVNLTTSLEDYVA